MQNKSILKSVAIILGVTTVFIVQMSSFSTYMSYLLAILIIFFTIYITLQKRSKTASQLFTGSPLELYGITSIILFIIALTNGLTSPLFFFLYFLLFLLAFIGDSVSVWILLAALLLYFLPEASGNMDSNTFIKIGSLVLIAPIAFFVAKELERRQLLNQQISSTTEDIKERAEALKGSINPTQVEETQAIDEIIEEAESLKKDSEN